jgi:hypothetical protein
MPVPAGLPSGKCTVCAHPERVRAELLLAGGAALNAVCRKFSGISRYALARHWDNHVGEERRATLLLGPVAKAALASRLAEESESVLDHHRATRCALYAALDTAVTANDRNAVALLAGRLTEVNNAIGRLTGQLINSPLVQQTTINFHASSEYVRLRDGLLQLAREHPDVRPHLIALLKRLDSEPNSTTEPMRPAPLMLEHEEAAHA